MVEVILHRDIFTSKTKVKVRVPYSPGHSQIKVTGDEQAVAIGNKVKTIVIHEFAALLCLDRSTDSRPLLPVQCLLGSHCNNNLLQMYDLDRIFIAISSNPKHPSFNSIHCNNVSHLVGHLLHNY